MDKLPDKKLKALTVDFKNLTPIPIAQGYWIHPNGSIYSIKKLSPRMWPDGYLRVHLFGNKKKKRLGIHQLLAITYIPNPNHKLEVRHLDGNKTNNLISNLAWGTRRENAQDEIRNGKTFRGEKNFKCKLTSIQVLSIRKEYDKTHKIRNIAKRYGVCKATIDAILSGKNWGWLI
jgi:hypothetical protein